MTVGASSNDLASLVLAFYREPLSRRALLKNRIESPGEAQRLLRAAGGLDGVSDELRRAASFAVEQIFFASGASYYQVMGLSPGATDEQIKNHHRLLMRLLHPDRSVSRVSWLDAYAGSVNEAYNVLRKPETRRVYDAALKRGERRRPSQTTGAQHVARVPSRHSGGRLNPTPLKRYRPVLLRYLPQLVLAGSALLAALFVSWVYLASSPTSAPIRAEDGEPPRQSLTSSVFGAEQSRFAPVAERELRLARQREARKQEVQRILARVARKRDERRVGERQTGEHGTGNRGALAVAASAAGTPANRERALRLRRDVQRREIEALLAWGRSTRAQQLWDRSVARRERRPPETKFELRPDPEQSSPPRAAADKARSRPEYQAALHREFSQKRPPGPSAPPRIISQGDLNLLLDRFVDTYNRGDLDGFMALFARRARMDEIGGKTAIRMDYQRIFGDTLSRRLAINLLDWQLVGAHAFGIGRYRVRVQRRGESAAESYTGVIRFEVSKQQGRVKITSLSHDVR